MATSSTADVIRIHSHGGPEQMKFETIDLSPPDAGQVQLRQTAVGLNFIDVYTRTGLYPGPTPAVLGVEAAGVIEAVGEGVEGLKVGDRVVPFSALTCGTCRQCLRGRDNLCENVAGVRGFHVDGFAQEALDCFAALQAQRADTERRADQGDKGAVVRDGHLPDL